MSFSFSDEQVAFREVVRRFLEDRSPVTAVRQMMEDERGFDAAVWRQACEELGLAGLATDERYGGHGFGMVELGIVAEEMGRALFCGPFFSSVVLAGRAIAHTGSTHDCERLLPALASGERRGTLALYEPGGSWQPQDAAVSCEPDAEGVRVNGVKSLVIDGMSADFLLVVARATGGDGLTLVLVEADASGVHKRSLTALDTTRKLAEVRFENAPGVVIGEAGAALPGLGAALREAGVMLAHESVGGAQRLFDDTMAYTQMRVQFGRLIASFQAIKHQCAELLLDLELSKSAAYYAAEALDEGYADAAAVASLAKAATSDHYMRMAANCIQLHGGIGFTWEQNTHLWYKRAKSSEVLLGTPDWHREQMMCEWVDGLDAASAASTASAQGAQA